MGFFEYAWAISLQKDNLLTKIQIDSNVKLPFLTLDKTGFTATIPEPLVLPDGTISFLGFNLPSDASGKIMAGKLFRASVVHLTAHTLMPDYHSRMKKLKRRSVAEVFSESIIDDIYVNAYTASHAKDKLADLGFANSVAFSRMKPIARIYNQSTRLMTALILQVNVGKHNANLAQEEADLVNALSKVFDELRESIFKSFTDERFRLAEVLDRAVDSTVSSLESRGPFVEIPALPHTEQRGPCKTFRGGQLPPEHEVMNSLGDALLALGYVGPLENSSESLWTKETDAEILQAFDSGFYLKVKEQKVLAKVIECLEGTRLRRALFPETDYTQYLRTRILLSGGTRRLLDSLRVAQDALDEDPGKEMGQLDLTAVIQVLASGKPATDVFMKDEYLSRSFSWAVLLDSSASMRVKGELGRALTICIAEATKELLSDPSSWGLFAFNDNFYVLKDFSETYSSRVRARIGGLKFDGLSFLPDAVRVAGSILSKRYDEQRFLVVISDGWPYGYSDIEVALRESIGDLEKRGVIVIGVGVETERMKQFFKLNSPIYDEKDLVRKFARIYVDASASALET
ncbi:MAG TPA: VWA domain-containing protein [Candidatus Eisenbacteria bacterium]|nr:VWA domain-containing protein [Candidatus Eisenbacteria bacterium]